MDIKKLYPLIIFISAVVFFIPFLGAVHLFDWDEINFAESAREMIVTSNYSRVQIDFQPFWEKPPLFFWLQALSMHVFGINEFAARFPNAITGIITLLTLYFIGKKLHDEKFGFIWSLSYLGSFLPHLYFKSGIIDPLFNYFIFLTVYFVAKSCSETNKSKSTLLFFYGGITIGLATLTKGPVGFLIVAITSVIFWMSCGFSKITTLKNILIYLFTFVIVSSLWFGLELTKNGPQFISEFFKYQLALLLTPVASHGEPFYYHFVVVFLGCFPISILALPALANRREMILNDSLNFKRWMFILFWVVMILFSLVKTKIVHYSSLSYYPLSFLAAVLLYKLLNATVELKKYLKVLLIIVGILFSILLIAAPLIAEHKELIIPFIKDKFAVACLSTKVQWNGWEFLIGFLYLIAMLWSIKLLGSKKIMKGIVLLFYSTAFCMFFYLKAVVPKIEAYSQAPAINFYKSIAGKNVYVSTVGFKSYAHLYYFQKMPDKNLQTSNDDWLINGTIDKPSYLVAKINTRDFFEHHPDCKLIKQEGGFLFYERLPAIAPAK